MSSRSGEKPIDGRSMTELDSEVRAWRRKFPNFFFHHEKYKIVCYGEDGELLG